MADSNMVMFEIGLHAFCSFLRSYSRCALIIPRSRLSSYGSRSFAVCGPAAWNSLPAATRDLSSYHLVSVSRLDYLPWLMALAHGSAFMIAYLYKNLLLLLVWHAPLGVRSAKRIHQSPEWTILSHSYRLIQGEIVRPQVLLDSLHSCSTIRTSWCRPRKYNVLI